MLHQQRASAIVDGGFRACSMLPAILAASGALAADADNGTPGGNVLRQLPYRLADRAQRRNRRPTI